MEGQALKQFISNAQQMLWAPPEKRAELQAHGIDLVPANFYSTIPTLEDLASSFENDTAPYIAGFDIREMRRELEELGKHTEGFNPPKEGNEEDCDSFFWQNTQFSYSDALSYYAYIRKLKPMRVVEVGSGFSSLVALEALRANGAGSLVCIEPYPRDFLVKLDQEKRIDLRKVKAQQVMELNTLLQDGDILFIDSTHTVKIGSDCLHIYLRLLPTIRKKILVHVHDIFLPFGMPVEWAKKSHIYWTEQYLLQAFLTDNPKVKIKFGSHFHDKFNKAMLNDFMRGLAPSGGSSFWFEYDGTKAI